MTLAFIVTVVLLAIPLSSCHPLQKMERKAFTNVSFDDLPLQASDPKYSAWGLWGKNDQLGRTNLITAEFTRQAAISEIQTGEVIPLK